jgi:hypothetical protein
MLVMEDSAGQPLSLGSGFFVRKDIVATNLHVIEGASGGYAKIVGAKPKYDITGYVAIDERRDLILLKIKDANVPVLALGDSDKVAVGDEIFAVGNPKGLEGTFSRGIVSAIRKVGEDSLLQITAPISPGSSGGPILNSEGDVIGISVAIFKGGQNLNFAIPASYLSSLLTNVKPLRPLSAEKDTHKKAKSILSDLGGRNTEGVIGEKLNWENEFYGYGGFSFTLRNQLRESVQDIYCLVIFYDRDDNPLDLTVVRHRGIIPGRLAKRVDGSVHESVKRITTPPSKDSRYKSSFTPSTKVEFRILDFTFVEESEEEL